MNIFTGVPGNIQANRISPNGQNQLGVFLLSGLLIFFNEQFMLFRMNLF